MPYLSELSVGFTLQYGGKITQFSLNVFTEFRDKNICHYSCTVKGLKPATSCTRDQDATTVPARHM